MRAWCPPNKGAVVRGCALENCFVVGKPGFLRGNGGKYFYFLVLGGCAKMTIHAQQWM